MPTDESLLEIAEEWKTKGNDAFGKGELGEAVSAYSQGIVLCDRIVGLKPALKATLLSNRAMCHLKTMNFQGCVDDCTTALDYQSIRGKQGGGTAEDDTKTRSKLLFRRAKAKFMQSNLPTSQLPAQPGDLLQDAAKDLLALLQIDPKSADANQLLTTVRTQHKMISTAVTPVSKTMNQIQDYLDKRDVSNCLHHVKILLGFLDNDNNNVSMEIGRLHGVQLLIKVATAFLDSSDLTDPTDLKNVGKVMVLSIRCIAQAGSHPPFVRTFLVNFQTDLCQLIQTAVTVPNDQYNTATSDLIVGALSCIIRVILHCDRDDPNIDISPETKQDYSTIVEAIKAALQPCVDRASLNDADNTNTILRAVLDVIGTWTAGVDRDNSIRAALTAAGTTDKTVPMPKTAMEIHVMTPQELAAHRRREQAKRRRDEQWAIDRAKCLLRMDEASKDGAMVKLLQAATACHDHVVRREVTVTVGKVFIAFQTAENDNDDMVKDAAKKYLQKPNQEKRDGPIIEEVYNDDGEIEEDDEAKQEAEIIDTLQNKMQRAVVACGMLMTCSKELGAWSLGTGWNNSTKELPELIDSGDNRAMCLASEVVSAASVNEGSRTIVASLVSGGNMEKLVMHEDRDIRSGAASAVAKIGLANNSRDEAEFMHMLEGACDLLEDRGSDGATPAEEEKEKDRSKKTGIDHFSGYATSSVERGVEMLNYLMTNTSIKEEVCAGFAARAVDGPKALDLLVKTADTPSVGETLTGFGLASIFRNMSATNFELRQLMFEEKEVTMEQYEQIEKMQKTEEEKELMEKDKDPDTEDLKKDRIRKMAASNVPRALVQLIEGASEHTLEQVAFCMSQMANEPSVRGSMIQQGILSACIKIEKNEGPTETDKMKNIIRLARHTIAKMLITTNPSLLTSAQRLGAIKPLLKLIRDIKAKDLQHFEALMALTNLASSGEDAKTRIASERGIPALHFAMFDEHEEVRRAATEAMCNLVPHKAMMDHLAETDNLRLWLSFADDYEENFECSRAAAGCLAMATQQDTTIAKALCKLPKFEEHATSMLESGRLEIMHRTFALVLNLVGHEETRDLMKKTKLVAFTRAYLENYIRNGTAGLEFPPEEAPLLNVICDLAKDIIRTAEPV